MQDLQAWLRQPKMIQRIFSLFVSMQRTPFEGIGKPEPLKYEFSVCWSRRIDDKHRIIYRVTDDMIIVLSCRDHYAE
jgi:toxin YoeB